MTLIENGKTKKNALSNILLTIYFAAFKKNELELYALTIKKSN